MKRGILKVFINIATVVLLAVGTLASLLIVGEETPEITLTELALWKLAAFAVFGAVAFAFRALDKHGLLPEWF